MYKYYYDNNNNKWRVPEVGITHDDETNEIQITGEFPGIDKENLEVTVTENKLILKAEKGDRRFKKVLVFRRPLAEEAFSATFENGLLTIIAKPTSPVSITIPIN